MSKFKDTIDSTGRRPFITGSLGLALGAATLSATTDLAQAHFPATLDIDVEPGTETNHILPESDGYVLVAVLGTDDFDPTSEVVRYRFGAEAAIDAGNGARPAFGGSIADVNSDGTDDLLLHFPVSATGFADCEKPDQIAKLVWERQEAGEHGYSGTSDVTIGRVVPNRGSSGGTDGESSTSDEGKKRSNDDQMNGGPSDDSSHIHSESESTSNYEGENIDHGDDC